jgi:hypothetical protein
MRLAASSRAWSPAFWQPRPVTRDEGDGVEGGNACFAIALACILSVPVWLAVGVAVYALLP